MPAFADYYPPPPLTPTYHLCFFHKILPVFHTYCRLYKSLGDYDTLRGIFSSQVGVKAITKKALAAEERTDYVEALGLYKKAIGCENWEDGKPSQVEEDLWDDSMLQVRSSGSSEVSLLLFPFFLPPSLTSSLPSTLPFSRVLPLTFVSLPLSPNHTPTFLSSSCSHFSLTSSLSPTHTQCYNHLTYWRDLEKAVVVNIENEDGSPAVKLDKIWEDSYHKVFYTLHTHAQRHRPRHAGTCTHTRARAHARTHALTHTHRAHRAHTRTHARTHTHAHAHTHAPL